MPPDYSDRQSDVERPSEPLFGISVAVCFLIVGLLPMAGGDAIRPWAIVVSIIGLPESSAKCFERAASAKSVALEFA